MYDSFDQYISGKKLYGDNFTQEEILQWFDTEKESYFKLKRGRDYNYEYHQLNFFHGYKFLKDRKFKNALGFGSAFGEEFIPILNKIENLIILESSEGFFSNKIKNLSVKYVKANPLGSLQFDDDTFDLITCLGVLHHISNVSYVLKELYRCLQKGGYMLIREPITSGGDWRTAREGLTLRERGIPLKIFDQILHDIGFEIICRRKCVFFLMRSIGYFFRTHGCSNNGFNNKAFVLLDYLLSKLFSFNGVYHAKNFWQKLRPLAIFYLVRK
jgi:SAM-dependent methyltransferase